MIRFLKSHRMAWMNRPAWHWLAPTPSFSPSTRLCEDDDVVSQLLRGLTNRRTQVDGWLAYLAEQHPVLANSALGACVRISRQGISGRAFAGRRERG